MLEFHRRWDLDLIKVMASGVYCVEDWGCRVAYLGSPNGAKQCTEHAVKTTADWARIRPLDPGGGALGRELEAVRRIRAGRPDDAPILHTAFSPFTIARKLAGERLGEDMAAAPDAVAAALEAITETTIRHARAALEAGADGVFFATQAAAADVLSAEAHARWDLPSARRVLEAVHPASTLTLLHVHGTGIHFDAVAALPAHAINWHDRLTAPTLAEAKRRRSAGAVVGGLAEGSTLRRGPVDAVAEQVRDALRQTDGIGVVVGPGCVVPLDVPDAHLAAVVDAVRKGR
jgi:uroporphyrinogen decarboxylase